MTESRTEDLHEKIFKIALKTAIPFCLLDTGKTFFRTNIINSGMLDNSLINTLYQNYGDLGNGMLISIYAGLVVDSFAPSLSEKIRAGISFAAGATAVCLTETVIPTGTLFGTPDLADIPAGIIGSVIYLGVRHLVRERFIQRQVNATLTPANDLVN